MKNLGKVFFFFKMENFPSFKMKLLNLADEVLVQRFLIEGIIDF